MLVEILRQTVRVPQRKVVTWNISPDFISTRLGFYKKSGWTSWAEERLFSERRMIRGLSISTYQAWLNWSYDRLALSAIDNPIARRHSSLANNTSQIPILWLMSFGEKNLMFDGRKIANEDLRLLAFFSEESKARVERELVKDRFGNRAIVERLYDAGVLTEASTLVVDEKRNTVVMRLDDMSKPAESQWYSNYIVADVGELPELMNVMNPVSNHLSKTRFLYQIYEA